MTSSTRQVQVIIPNDDPNLFDLVDEFLKDETNDHIINSVYQFQGNDSVMYLFRCTASNVGEVLDGLRDLGAGVDSGLVNIVPLNASDPFLFQKPKPGQKKRPSNGLSTGEIFDMIDGMLKMSTWDYSMLTITAAMVAASGLAFGSSVLVLAAMIIAPFLSPLLGFTLGLYLKDTLMIIKGAVIEWMLVLLAIFVGIIFGAVLAFAQQPWHDDFMRYGSTEALIYGGIVAIASGGAVSIGVSHGGLAPLIGVAISASLLPPVVNCGMSASYGTVSILFLKSISEQEFWGNYMRESMFSFLIYALNILFVVIGCLVGFRIKRVKVPKKKFDMFGTFLSENSRMINAAKTGRKGYQQV
eukprot:TRINITY_DN141_c0_g1_i1.p1 TRINITY_DN141_c0_g1~~TRINITY_DN141_c0_g1_i1.p1  ORF type:complete len:356 (-),score=77.48 TRINITY_DN141_c0_g1_i1:130-1197(-)